MKKLGTKIIGKQILTYTSLPSTNDMAKQLAVEGAAEGTVVVAETQTAGKGRQGRNWVSPVGQGLWMSVILRPTLKVVDTPLVALAAAVAVERAITRVSGVQAGIKWPNDLVVDGKKLAGILVEMQATNAKVKYMILGVGTNLVFNQSDLPVELADKITSLQAAGGGLISREEYLMVLLEELDKVYLQLSAGEFELVLQAWRQKTITLGNKIRAEGPTQLIYGMATDIDRTGALLVTTEDGKQVKILSGDVTVRAVDGKYC